MPTEPAKLTNNQLAVRLEKSCNDASKAMDAVYTLALHGHEKYSEIEGRLGMDHPAVVAYERLLAIHRAYKDEASRRLGPHYDNTRIMANALLSYRMRVSRARK